MRLRLIENKIKLREILKKRDDRVYITTNLDYSKYEELDINSPKYEDSKKDYFRNVSNSFKFDSSMTYIQSSKTKPEGLWYCYDESWINFLLTQGFLNDKGESTSKAQDSKVFNVNTLIVADIPILKNKNILKLRTEKQYLEFYSKYKSGLGIDWKEVSQDYEGIEITQSVIDSQYNIEDFITREILVWWDIPSGCIWRGLDKIQVKRIIPLTDYFEYRMNPYINNPYRNIK